MSRPELPEPEVQLTPEEEEAFEARRAESKKKLADYAEKVGASPLTEKQQRLLFERRVSVRSVTPGRVEATAEGDSGDHVVWWSDIAGWNCDCEAWRYRRTCAHVRAVSAVVRLETTEEDRSR